MWSGWVFFFHCHADLAKEAAADSRTCVSLTSRIGQHQSSDAAPDHSQAQENSTGQDTKLTQSNNTHAFSRSDLFSFSLNDCKDKVGSDSYLSRVFLFVLEEAGGKNCCTDPGFSYVVAQLRHAEDARLHQTPATQ